MISLAYPWLLLLIPLPILMNRWLPAYRQRQQSLRIPRLRRLAGLTGQTPASGTVVRRRTLRMWVLLAIAWLCTLAAVTRPQWVGEPITRTIPSRDLLLAVDLSGSMSTEDFKDSDGNRVDRLTACKQVLDEFLTRREGDRVGLIFFGSGAFVQAPFTEDLDLVRKLLDEAQVGMAGPQTVIGDAVGLAMTVFQRSDQEDRVLILLTDGNDTGSKVTPQEAARIGRDKSVTIHTIAVGDPQAVGEEKIDEVALQDMARVTGGEFYRANDRQELAGIYQALDALDSRELEVDSYRPKTELFYWPLLVFLITGLIAQGFRLLNRPWFSKQINHVGQAVLLFGVVCFCAGMSPLTAWSQFHFIRPAWLLALIPTAIVGAVLLGKQRSTSGLQGWIDPHLLKHLVVHPESKSKWRPEYLLCLGWLLTVIAMAGPAWQREPSPFASDQAALIFVLEVSPTMLAQDIQPTRLQRAAQKVRDLLALRPGVESALIAYAGSAHLVMPITTDTDIIVTFANELDPKVMPKEGDQVAQAIRMANQQLRSAGRPGSIVLFTDGVDPAEYSKLGEQRQAPVHILAIAGEQSKPLPLDSPPAPALDLPGLQAAAEAANASLTVVTADDRDIQKLSRNINTSFVAARQQDGGQRWQDMGYWLTPMIALIVLFWFRAGWMVGRN